MADGGGVRELLKTAMFIKPPQHRAAHLFLLAVVPKGLDASQDIQNTLCPGCVLAWICILLPLTVRKGFVLIGVHVGQVFQTFSKLNLSIASTKAGRVHAASQPCPVLPLFS